MSPFVLDRSLSPLPPFLPPIYLFIICTISVAQLWQNFFQLAVAFTCQTTLQLQGISEVKRGALIIILTAHKEGLQQLSKNLPFHFCSTVRAYFKLR